MDFKIKFDKLFYQLKSMGFVVDHFNVDPDIYSAFRERVRGEVTHRLPNGEFVPVRCYDWEGEVKSWMFFSDSRQGFGGVCANGIMVIMK